MPQLSEYTGPGYLCVTSHPKPGYVGEYNDCCDAEYGPLRLKLDFNLTGYRYRSTEDPSKQLTTYDLKKISGLTQPPYTTLISNPPPREQDLLNHKPTHLDQRIYTPISTRGHLSTPAPVMMSVAFVVQDADVPELHRWYEEVCPPYLPASATTTLTQPQEHTHDLQQIPGWQRSRRFQLIDSTDLKPGHTELLAVHEFGAVNGLDGPEHELAKLKPWRNRILTLVVSRKNQRYEFVREVRAGDIQKPAEAGSSSSLENNSSGMPKGISNVS